MKKKRKEIEGRSPEKDSMYFMLIVPLSKILYWAVHLTRLGRVHVTVIRSRHHYICFWLLNGETSFSESKYLV